MDTKIQWTPPYRGRGVVRSDIRNETGVYIIREASTKRIVYIGMSKSCLYKALYRHFQSWFDPKRKRVVYSERSSYEIRVVKLKPVDVDYVERRMIRYFNPPDNKHKYRHKTKTSDTPF